MKIYRIFPQTKEMAYISSTGLPRNLRSSIRKGEKLSNDLKFSFEEKNSNAIIPDFLGTSNEFFISDKLKPIFEKYCSKEHLNFIETKIFKSSFYLLNVLCLRKAVDRSNSIFTEFESGNIDEVETLVFDLKDISEYDIFRLEGYKVPVFITEKLKHEIEKVIPTGIYFSDPQNVLELNF